MLAAIGRSALSARVNGLKTFIYRSHYVVRRWERFGKISGLVESLTPYERKHVARAGRPGTDSRSA